MIPRIDIDSNSGFCFGVTTAINKAEETLSEGSPLYSLGDIVHNSAEMERLSLKGLKTISHADLDTLQNVRVLLRAHGEPPATYAKAAQRNIKIVDATCPVVLKLQQRIKKDYEDARNANHDLQIVIYGQPGHAEVNGLVGQTESTAIVIESPDRIDRIDMSRDISLYSQTTKSLEGFKAVIDSINAAIKPGVAFKSYDTICRQVSNRVSKLKQFVAEHDVILFVAGAKSSNGKVLFNHCLSVNSRTFLVSEPADIHRDWLDNVNSIGICGATSTPRWLMEQVADVVRNFYC